MTDKAELEWVGEDAHGALAFILHARTFTGDGSQQGNAPESRQVLLHNAVVAACDAVLALDGFTVRGSEGGHRLRLDEAAERLALERDLVERLQGVRDGRNRVSYRGFPALIDDVDEAARAVADLLDIVEDHARARLPDWAKDSLDS